MQSKRTLPYLELAMRCRLFISSLMLQAGPSDFAVRIAEATLQHGQ